MNALVLILVLVGVALVAYLQWRREQDRRDAFGELAVKLSFQFEGDANAADEAEYERFEIFRRGHSRAALNTLVGEIQMNGRSCRTRCGDFRYRVTHYDEGRTTTTTYHFSYVMVELPWHTPDLLIRPEGIFDRVAGAFGFEDINFESAEFSKRFYVKSSNRKFAYDVIHPRMMEFLLSEQPPMLDLEHGAICCSDGAERWAPGTFEATIAFLGRFFELWPRYLLEQQEAKWGSSSSLPSSS